MSTNYTNFANHNSKNSALQIELMMAGALGCVIALITISILCERFCCRRSYRGRTALVPAASDQAHNQSSGLDLSVIANLPTFGYKRHGDDDHGVPAWLQCVVCLCLVQEGEEVRQLPTCRHLFHQECIDMWLYLHSTCPICRLTVAAAEQEKDRGTTTSSPVPV